jgi:lipopolysaccharide/colanic/teichoic acid biosynthesis glycosyltransferase/O-antigen/teichoic acid export membrane protein
MTMTMMRPVTPPQEEPDTPDPLARGSAQRAAIITLILAIVFQPILHPTGPGNSSPVDLLIVAAIAAALVWLAGTHRKLRAPYFIPVAMFVIAGAASGLVSSMPTTALITVAIDLLLFAWCTTVVNVLSAPRAMRCALVAWSWSGIAWAGVVIAAWLGHITPLEGLTAAEGNRVMFTFGDPNYASWYWVATMFVIYASRSPAKRWMRFTGYGMLAWALVLTESNGGVLALGVGISFLLMVKYYRRHGWAGVVATGLVIGLAVGAFFTVLPLNEIRQLAANSNQPLLVNSIGRSAQSSSERGLLIQESLELYQHSDGLIGLGPASTKPLLGTGLYPYANEAHDDFLAALSERGVLGLFALLLLCACVVARASPVLRRQLSPSMAAAVPHPAGIVAGVLVVSVNSFYEEVLHFRPLWLLFGITAVLGRDAWQVHQADRRRWFARLRPATMTRPVIRPSGEATGGDGAAAGYLRGPLAPYIPPVPAALPAGASQHGSRLLSRNALTNLGAQGGALAAVSVASLLVARTGGPTVVGEYALIRVLPWLFGVIFSCGLPTASAFFLAGEHGKDRRVRPTLTLMAVAGAAVGSLAWLACVIPFHHVFFKQMPISLVFVMTALVVTQLWTVTAKGCCQGSGDIMGANLVIVAEELWFVPIYPAVLLTVGYKGATSVVIALIASGTLAMLTGLVRLWQRGYFTGWGRPSRAMAKKIAAFGGRGQLGNMLWLMNLRFDFILLGALAGPAVLGIYAVASKFAELMRLAPTALNYVLYPRFARLGADEATTEARRLLPQATALTLIMTPVVAVGTFIGLPLIYGKVFRSAVTPAEIIIIGLSIEGAAAVSSAFLLGRGRPGLNSVGMGVGAAITVTLDIILIPRYGALGGAITSAITYLTTTMVLVLLARRQFRATTGTDGHALARLKVKADSGMRRAVDVLVAGIALTITGPVIVLLAAAVRFTSRGPAFYRQVRTGSSGEQFTILKLRSMVSGADRVGPLVTSRADSRVTALGALLRATKLDELPQLINVLRGDMTLIGPRPEVPRFIPCYDDEELEILSVRPGLTGPGQIFYTQVQQATVLDGADPEQHYATCELHAKLAIDLDYLRRRGLRFDLLILVRTVLLLTKLAKPVAAPQPAQHSQRVEDDERTIVFPAWSAPPESMAGPGIQDDERTIVFPAWSAPPQTLAGPGIQDDERTIVLPAWSAPPETLAGPGPQLPPWAEPHPGPGTKSVAATLPRSSAEFVRAARAITANPDDQPTLTELDDLPVITEPDDEFDDQPTATESDGERPGWFFLELLAVILVAAMIGSILVFLLK